MRGYLAGVLFGDGSLFYGKNKAYSVWIDQHQRNLKVLDKVAMIFSSEGYKIFRYSAGNNKFRVLVYSKDLFADFTDLKKDPVKYFQSLTRQEKMKFIEGFFDAEGTFTNRIVLYNSRIELLKTLQKFMDDLQIHSNLYQFGKVSGLQIHRKGDIEKFCKRFKPERIGVSHCLG